ncbi:protein of unknown function DUF721 [Thermodesulfobium narugense DSM 14796]|uniref:DUF721 domain-containing protein n=1 Tax=Thermodesulfobium narugense DSM 14796 TaxID=747365 RepID=M1E413_9BACT|nr:DciA family protein [Thermodesulfobium narugense]AEE13657.1 protein of unknown function DUF721 [Thermodesulfobium narugense DSM 14796]
MDKIDSIILNQIPKNLRQCFIIEKNWHEIVGLKLSKISKPIKLSNKTLVISTTHPIISREISLYSNIIIDRVKKKLNIAIENLKFKTSNFETNEEEEVKEKEKRQAVNINYPDFFIEIKDENIRKKVLNIYKTLKIKENKGNKGDE